MTPGYADAICAHGAVGWLIAAGPGSLFAQLAIKAYEHGWTMWRVPKLVDLPLLFGVTAGVLVLSGFMFFEIFAWLGLQRLRYANRERAGG